MSSEHYVYVCKHGRTIRQCRCPDPNKIVVASKCIESCPPDDIQDVSNECGSFGCKLAKGHNMGNADIPENHMVEAQNTLVAVQPEPRYVIIRFLDQHTEEYDDVLFYEITEQWVHLTQLHNSSLHINAKTVEELAFMPKDEDSSVKTVSIPNIKPVLTYPEGARGLMKSVTNTFVDSYGITTHYDDGSATTTSHKDFNNG